MRESFLPASVLILVVVLLRRLLRRMRADGRNQKHFLIVGWNEMAEELNIE